MRRCRRRLLCAVACSALSLAVVPLSLAVPYILSVNAGKASCRGLQYSCMLLLFFLVLDLVYLFPLKAPIEILAKHLCYILNHIGKGNKRDYLIGMMSRGKDHACTGNDYHHLEVSIRQCSRFAKRTNHSFCWL